MRDEVVHRVRSRDQRIQARAVRRRDGGEAFRAEPGRGDLFRALEPGTQERHARTTGRVTTSARTVKIRRPPRDLAEEHQGVRTPRRPAAPPASTVLRGARQLPRTLSLLQPQVRNVYTGGERRQLQGLCP